jgi:hypothetical protein
MGWLLSQLGRAPARLRADLHAIEHSPGSGAVALWPAAISPTGWLESPPARRASERALVVRSATRSRSRLRIAARGVALNASRRGRAHLVPAHDRLASGQPE